MSPGAIVTAEKITGGCEKVGYISWVINGTNILAISGFDFLIGKARLYSAVRHIWRTAL